MINFTNAINFSSAKVRPCRSLGTSPIHIRLFKDNDGILFINK
jgi:hypothetical protein